VKLSLLAPSPFALHCRLCHEGFPIPVETVITTIENGRPIHVELRMTEQNRYITQVFFDSHRSPTIERVG
jgi:hypothetical protein